MTTPAYPSFEYAPTPLACLGTLDAYLASLTSPIDSFLEDHILDSEPFAVLLEGREVGLFAKKDDGLLTCFHVDRSVRRWDQALFAEIRDRFDVKAAAVPTCDELFLGLAMDDYVKIDKGAFFFVDGPVTATPSLREGLVYRPAQPGDLAAIRKISGDFLEDPAVELEKGQLHVGLLDEEIVALGLIVRGRLQTVNASLGIFTREDRRREGIATSTIDYLRHACADKGLRPVAGCWYYNDASKRALEAAGMIVSSRLLRFVFSEDA